MRDIAIHAASPQRLGSLAARGGLLRGTCAKWGNRPILGPPMCGVRLGLPLSSAGHPRPRTRGGGCAAGQACVYGRQNVCPGCPSAAGAVDGADCSPRLHALEGGNLPRRAASASPVPPNKVCNVAQTASSRPDAERRKHAVLWSVTGGGLKIFAASTWALIFKAVRSAASWGFDVSGSGYPTQEGELSPISLCCGDSEEASMTASHSTQQLKTRKRRGTSPTAGWIFVLW